MHYWLLCGWGLCLFLAFLGYGKLVLGLFSFRDAPWALASSMGVVFAVTAGGVLNLLHLVRAPILEGAVAIGVLLALGFEWPHLRSLPSTLLGTSLMYSPLILAAAVPILGNVSADFRTFNYIDDYPAYLTLPAATVQSGSLPFDPFSERRITSCLGAPYLLQSLTLVTGDIRTVRFVDISLGFALYTGLLVVIFRLMGLPMLMRMVLASLALLVPVDRWNATMVVMPAALFCALLLILVHPALGSRMSWRRSVLMAMTAAAIACMKSNYLPASIAICGFYFLAWLVYGRRAMSILQTVVWAGALAGCLIPWMIDMKAKEGTYLFPLLGRGYDASAYGLIPLPNGSHESAGSASLWVWLTALPLALPLLVGLAGLAFAFRRRVGSAWVNPIGAMLAGSAVAIVAIAASTGGESLGRYSLPFVLPALIILIGFLMACQREMRKSLWWLNVCGAATVIALAVLAFAFGVRHGDYYHYLEDARLANLPVLPWLNPQAEEQRVHALQSVIPPGDRILARLFLTYPFDFKRNQVFVEDYSGMAGLPPGMPIEGEPAEMREYLLAHQIRYLAFDPNRTMLPDTDPGISLRELLHRRRDFGRHGWLVLQIKVSNTVEQTFGKLGQQYRHVYDDGVVYVADLKTPR